MLDGWEIEHMQCFSIFFNAMHMSNFTSPLVVDNVVYYMELLNAIKYHLGHTFGTKFTNITLKGSAHVCPIRVVTKWSYKLL